jgi:hypothetical protein
VAEHKKQLSAPKWFGRADEFMIAAGKLQDNLSPAIPIVVCRAFAAEAYLKCLLTVRQKHFPPDHDLKRLFTLLPLADKQYIEESWNRRTLAKMPKPGAPGAPVGLVIPKTLQQALKQARHAFKEWRYTDTGVLHWFVGSFPDDTRRAILTAHPEWEADPPDSFGKFGKRPQIPQSEKPNNAT